MGASRLRVNAMLHICVSLRGSSRLQLKSCVSNSFVGCNSTYCVPKDVGRKAFVLKYIKHLVHACLCVCKYLYVCLYNKLFHVTRFVRYMISLSKLDANSSLSVKLKWIDRDKNVIRVSVLSLNRKYQISSKFFKNV